MVENITSVEVSKDNNSATITMDKHVPIAALQNVLDDKYKITAEQHNEATEEVKSWLETYKPILLVFAYISGITLLIQTKNESPNWSEWMRHFMAGFFIVFAFFKLLNLKGFADSYKMYDIIAARWSAWGYIYPFVELTLGVLYLINLAPLATNISTAIILGVSSIGVIKSNLDKKKIRCACLGDVFNLPMSTVTIVEDLTMVGMAVFMLFSYQIL